MFRSSVRQSPPINHPWVRVLIIVVPLLVVLAAAFTLSWPQPLYVLGGLGALIGALIFLQWPILGITFLVASTTIIPLTVSTGTKTSLNFTVMLVPALLGLWFFDMIARKRHFQLYFTSAVFAGIGLAIAAFLAFVLGQLPWFALTPAPLTAQVGGLAVFLFSVGAFLLTIHQIEDQVWLRRITFLFLFLATLQMVATMMPNILPFRRIFHPLNSSLVLTWLIALAYSLSLFNRRLNMGWRVILLLIVVLAFFLTLFRLRAWASGWMPGVVAVLVITWAWRPRLGMVLGVLCVGVSLIYMNDIIGIVILEDNFYSVDSRLAAWKVLLELINVNPFLGLGPANYYWYTPLYSILGFNVQFNSHNQYVDIIAQTGLIGIAFFGWWAFAVARLGWRLRNKVAAGFEKAFVYAALGGLAGTLFAGMLGDWILPFVYNVGLNGFRGSVVAWLMLGGLVALDRIYREKEMAVDSEQ
jgi:hypothetical protein